MSTKNYPFNPELDLMIERVVELPPETIYKAWTTPDLLMKWFCPKPWTVSECEIDLRPGGRFYTMMKSPDGGGFPNVGCYIEIVKNEKLVWTDAMTEDFRPSEKSFMTAVLTLEKHPKGTLYRAVAKHKNVEDRKAHENMGFLTGWSTVLDQLIEVMKAQ